MKSFSQAAIALIACSVQAQSNLEGGVLYYGSSTGSTSKVAVNAWCDNPNSECDTGLCCGIGNPDSTVSGNGATIPIQICATPPTGLTSSVVIQGTAPLTGTFVFKCNSY